MARYAHERGTRFISIGATGNFGQTPVNVGLGAAGAGDEIGLSADASTFRLPSNYNWDFVISGGVFTALDISLQRSQDGTNWTDIDNSTTATGDSHDIANKPAKYLRLKVNSSTVNSGTPRITGGITV